MVGFLLVLADFGSGLNGDALQRDDALGQLIDGGLDERVKLILIHSDAALFQPGNNVLLLLFSVPAALENLLSSGDGDFDPGVDFRLLGCRGLGLDERDEHTGNDDADQSGHSFDDRGDVVHDKSSLFL